MKTVHLQFTRSFTLAVAIFGLVFTQPVLVIRTAEATGRKAVTAPTEAPSAVVNKTKAIENYGKLPLSFVPNHGQTDASVKFTSRGNGYTLFLTGNEAVMGLHNAETYQLKLKLIGANASPQIVGQDQFVGKSNYFIGNDQSKWSAGIPMYGKVRYSEIWPGVDVVWYGKEQDLEYDFIVRPGVDPQQIRLAFEGAESMRLDAEGNLLVKTKAGELIQKAPVIYQDGAQGRKSVQGKYRLTAANEFAFEIGDYDATRPLVIDPVLAMATYLGGSLLDNVIDVAMDSAGNVYCTGRLDSAEFPPGSGGKQGQATYVAKISADGTTLIYATVLDGQGSDFGETIAVNSSNQVVVSGNTNSNDFPLLLPFEDTLNPGVGGGSNNDAFVTKLDANGVLNANCGCSFSTYLGGSSSDFGRGIAFGSDNRVYVVGETESTNFPKKNQFQGNGVFSGQDAFLTVFAANGQSLIYSTYFRGGSSDLERAAGVAVDSSGNAYVIGQTDGNNIQTRGANGTSPAQANNAGGMDAFVAKFNPALTGDSSLIYASYLGGSGTEFVGDIAVDSQQRAYAIGQTGSFNFPLNAVSGATVLDTTNQTNEAFVTCFNSNGSARVFSTFLGGNGQDDGQAITVDSVNNVYVNISTTSNQNLPLVNPIQGALAGGWDSYIAKLSPEGRSILFSTYLGGSGTETSFGISALPSGESLVVGGVTLSTNFPVTPGAFQPQKSGDRDGFVARIKFENPDTIGVYRPSNSNFFLRNTNTTGNAEITVGLGSAGDIPIAGDWDGDGDDEPGVFRPSTGQFILRKSSISFCFFPPCTITLNFGQFGDLPVVGDWNGDGIDTVGVYRIINGSGNWLLSNSPNVNGTTPVVNIPVFAFGLPGQLPVVGDWNGDGRDTVGVFQGLGQFAITNQLLNFDPNEAFFFIVQGADGLPVTGDWNDDGIDTVGLFNDGVVFLRNTNSTGPADLTFGFGQAGDQPVAGDWNGLPIS